MGGSLAIAAVALTPFAALAPPEEMPGADALASLADPRRRLHRAGVRDLRRADRRDRAGPRARDHLRQPGRRGRARRRGARRARRAPGPIAGLLLIIAGSWLSTDGRLPPGLVGIAARRRERRRAAAQSPLSPAIRRSKPAGAWMLNIRTGVLPWLVNACGDARGDEHERAGRRGDLLAVAQLEGHLALEDVERVVLVGVDVRLEVAAGRDVDDPEREARRVRGAGEELDVAVARPFARRDDDCCLAHRRSLPVLGAAGNLVAVRL